MVELKYFPFYNEFGTSLYDISLLCIQALIIDIYICSNYVNNENDIMEYIFKLEIWFLIF